ncbi:pancreatic lipase-related protein 2 [Aplysia californica]|uniref:Pancreatic lipase-related protein 2 n=1 Tax=Aplysia californica TaxID=6500 RepID=A0ABM0K3F3_APLCA|nr:pancreatic lipase-related protein 2 [Aplysia californica]
MGKVIFIIFVQALVLQTAASASSSSISGSTHATTPKPYRTVCYPPLGCFSNRPPFHNAGGSVPASPESLNVGLRLYTRANRASYESLDYKTTNSRRFSNQRDTKIIVHGFANSGDTEWVVKMKDALLSEGDYNVIVVDWHSGAGFPFYEHATANIRVVAAEIKVLLEGYERKGLNLTTVHFIGHSLGAHLSGNAGSMLGSRIGRISGLDPAGPNFENTPDVVRLDKGDAQFVDALHTNGAYLSLISGGFGIHKSVGLVDFFVNGGQHQPGCRDSVIGKKRFLSSLGHQVSCSHGRVHEIYIESIKSRCSFLSYPCKSYEEFQKGNCLTCSNGGCSSAGYFANKHPSTGGKYLMTNDHAPFCGNHFDVYVKGHEDAPSRTDGTIYVALVGTQGETNYTRVTIKNRYLNGSIVTDNLVLFNKDVGEVQSIRVKYVKDPGFFAHGKNNHVISAVHLKSGINSKSYTTCVSRFELQTGVARTIPVRLVSRSRSANCEVPAYFG